MTQVITKEQVLKEIEKELEKDLFKNELNGSYGIDTMVGDLRIYVCYSVDAEEDWYDEYETNYHECHILSAHTTVTEFQLWDEELEEEVDILSLYEVEDYIEEFVQKWLVD